MSRVVRNKGKKTEKRNTGAPPFGLDFVDGDEQEFRRLLREHYSIDVPVEEEYSGPLPFTRKDFASMTEALEVMRILQNIGGSAVLAPAVQRSASKRSSNADDEDALSEEEEGSVQASKRRSKKTVVAVEIPTVKKRRVAKKEEKQEAEETSPAVGPLPVMAALVCR